jgi:DNA-binding SARP family transcriptional activator
MNEHSKALVSGIAALLKTVLLLAGVPAALIRLWLLAPGTGSPIKAASWRGGAIWSHAVLALVGALWLAAAANLGRDLVRALRGRLVAPSGSWSARWASRIAGLVLLVSAGSAIGTSVAGATVVPVHAVAPTVSSSPRGGALREQPPAAHVYVVRTGDCLASIAAVELGNAGDWPALARLNMGRLQPDGRRMTDASLIYPGWEIALPGLAEPTRQPTAPLANGTASAETRVAGTAQSVDLAPYHPAAGVVLSTAPTQETMPRHSTTSPRPASSAPTSNAGAHAVPGRADRSGTTRSNREHVATSQRVNALDARVAGAGALPTRQLAELALLGVGVLGAAGVARRLRLLRRLGECLRRPGERLPLPEDSVGRAMAAVDPLAEAALIDWVDAANRILWRAFAGSPEDHELPDVRVVRAGPDGVELHLARAIADTPDGFVPLDGGNVWALDASLGLTELAAMAEGCGRYVPALVPVGDAEDATYLVALGPDQRLALDSLDGSSVDAVLRAILVALRTLPWTDELQVELLGIDAPAPAERCHRLNGSSPAELAELARAGPPDRRSRLAATWASDVLVVVGEPWPPGVDEDLLAAVGRVAGLVTVGGAGTARLVVGESSMVLEPDGIVLRRSTPSREQLELIEAMLVAAADDPVLDADADCAHANAHTVLESASGPWNLEGPADSGHIEPGASGVAPADPPGADRALLPATREALLAPIAGSPLPPVAGTRDSDAPWRHSGPVEVRVLTRSPAVEGWAAVPSTKDRSRVVELVGYLALHDYATTTDRIRDTVFSRGDRIASLGRVHNVCSAARSALGATPEGNSYLPVSGGGRYRLDRSVSCDWSRFESMRKAATRAGADDAVELLVEALSLVDGPPLADVTSGWDWVMAEGLLTTIVSSIVDCAHHLTTLAAAEGNVQLARWALARGRSVEPWSEILARDAMVVSDLDGDLDGVRRAWRELEHILDDLEGNEPSPETRALYEELTGAAGRLAGSGPGGTAYRSARNG